MPVCTCSDAPGWGFRWLGHPGIPVVLPALLGLLLVEPEGRHGRTVQDLSPGEQTGGSHRRAAPAPVHRIKALLKVLDLAVFLAWVSALHLEIRGFLPEPELTFMGG